MLLDVVLIVLISQISEVVFGKSSFTCRKKNRVKKAVGGGNIKVLSHWWEER